MAGGHQAPPSDTAPTPRTSLPVLQGTPRHLAAHLRRLEAGASAMERPVDWVLALEADLLAWLGDAVVQGDGALRLRLFPDEGLLSVRLEPLPAPPRPCRLVPLPHPLGKRKGDPRVIHKGLSGPWGAEVLAMARGLGADDALLLWPDGSLAETALASVGIEFDGLFTLPPPQGRVASLAERLDLPAWANSRGLQLGTGDLSLTQARQGQVWCMNALRGIWPAELL